MGSIGRAPKPTPKTTPPPNGGSFAQRDPVVEEEQAPAATSSIPRTSLSAPGAEPGNNNQNDNNNNNNQQNNQQNQGGIGPSNYDPFFYSPLPGTQAGVNFETNGASFGDNPSGVINRQNPTANEGMPFVQGGTTGGYYGGTTIGPGRSISPQQYQAQISQARAAGIPDSIIYSYLQANPGDSNRLLEMYASDDGGKYAPAMQSAQQNHWSNFAAPQGYYQQQAGPQTTQNAPLERPQPTVRPLEITQPLSSQRLQQRQQQGTGIGPSMGQLTNSRRRQTQLG